MNWYKKSQLSHGNRGIQEYGDYSNKIREHYLGKEIAEGECIDYLRRLFMQGRFSDFNDYVKKLQEEGHKQDRINSMVSSTTRGKIPTTIT